MARDYTIAHVLQFEGPEDIVAWDCTCEYGVSCWLK